MRCPKCRDEEEQMQPETYKGIEIDRCPICKGVYLDRGELTELIAKKLGNRVDQLAFSAISDAMDDVSALCPRCEQPMPIVILAADIRANQCQHCAAIFLDQGELASLQLHYR